MIRPLAPEGSENLGEGKWVLPSFGFLWIEPQMVWSYGHIRDYDANHILEQPQWLDECPNELEDSEPHLVEIELQEAESFDLDVW